MLALHRIRLLGNQSRFRARLEGHICTWKWQTTTGLSFRYTHEHQLYRIGIVQCSCCIECISNIGMYTEAHTHTITILMITLHFRLNCVFELGKLFDPNDNSFECLFLGIFSLSTQNALKSCVYHFLAQWCDNISPKLELSYVFALHEFRVNFIWITAWCWLLVCWLLFHLVDIEETFFHLTIRICCGSNEDIINRSLQYIKICDSIWQKVSSLFVLHQPAIVCSFTLILIANKLLYATLFEPWI